MIVNAELFVNGLPGQLIGSLEPISLVDGNILGVVHNRDKIIDHRICVNLTFEIDDRRLDELKDLWTLRPFTHCMALALPNNAAILTPRE